MPNSINYLGGGLKNTGTPIEHYKIIDERRSESRKIDKSAKTSEVFAKALSKEKINDAIKKNEPESIANKAVKSLDKDSTLGARNIRLNKSGANVAPSLAKNGKTIICTIHQPSSELFEMFDKFCLISEGRLAYIGNRLNAINFFEK